MTVVDFCAGFAAGFGEVVVRVCAARSTGPAIMAMANSGLARPANTR